MAYYPDKMGFVDAIQPKKTKTPKRPYRLIDPRQHLELAQRLGQRQKAGLREPYARLEEDGEPARTLAPVLWRHQKARSVRR